MMSEPKIRLEKKSGGRLFEVLALVLFVNLLFIEMAVI